MKGLSITLVFGKWAGIYIKFEQYAWHICLGFVALTVYPRTDIEEFIQHLKQIGNEEIIQTIITEIQKLDRYEPSMWDDPQENGYYLKRPDVLHTLGAILATTKEQYE